MKHLLTLLALVALVCPVLAQTTVQDSMMYNGLMRHVRVYIPANRKCSMIIHLHGYSSTAALEQTFTNYMPVADTAGFLVAYPDGLKDGTGNQYWNVGWSTLPNTDDLGFLSALIDTLNRRYQIDPNAVFASGLSNGGFMCHRLACELSNKVAAIASVAGSMTTAEYTSCAPTRAVPVMEIHGTADATVPYTGTTGMTNSVDVDTVVRHCADLDLCNPNPVHNLLAHNAATTNGSSVDHYVYSGGTAGATCELYRINGGMHVEWAGAFGSFDFNASREIWRFFRDYRVGNCAGLGVSAKLTEGVVSIYPNPVDGEVSLNIQHAGMTEATIIVRNTLGQAILRMTPHGLNGSYQKHINTAEWRAGIYTLEVVTGKLEEAEDSQQEVRQKCLTVKNGYRCSEYFAPNAPPQASYQSAPARQSSPSFPHTNP